MVTNRDRKSDRAEIIPKVAQTAGTVDVFDPRSDISVPTSRRASACPNKIEQLASRLSSAGYSIRSLKSVMFQ